MSPDPIQLLFLVCLVGALISGAFAVAAGRQDYLTFPARLYLAFTAIGAIIAIIGIVTSW